MSEGIRVNQICIPSPRLQLGRFHLPNCHLLRYQRRHSDPESTPTNAWVTILLHEAPSKVTRDDAASLFLILRDWSRLPGNNIPVRLGHFTSLQLEEVLDRIIQALIEGERNRQPD